MNAVATSDIYRCSPRNAIKLIAHCIDRGLVPYTVSSPGMGKSSIHAYIADLADLKLLDVRLSGLVPEDITGLPTFNEQGYPEFRPFVDMFPVRGMELPPKLDKDGNIQRDADGQIIRYKGWLLFLDEMPNASIAVQKAVYKLILDRMVGMLHLHENVYIAAAGNKASDRALVGTLSTALQSRVVHIELELNFDEWLEDVGIAHNYDPRIIAYLQYDRDVLMDFKPDHEEKTYCCPRTWQMVDKAIKGEDQLRPWTILLAGTITSGVAVKLVNFSEIYTQLVTITEILKDPANTRIPGDLQITWSTVSHLMMETDEKTFPAVAQYVNRMDLQWKILFYRAVFVRHPKLRYSPTAIKMASTISSYLN